MTLSRAAIDSEPFDRNGCLKDDERPRYVPQPQPEQNRA